MLRAEESVTTVRSALLTRLFNYLSPLGSLPFAGTCKEP